jgi:hypothetical protein
MAAQAVEYSTFTFTITEGTAVNDAVIGTVGGAIIGTHLTRVGSRGNQHDYHLIVTHDTVGTNALEYSVRQATVTNGSAFTADTAFRTNAGAAQASAVVAHSKNSGSVTYDIIVVHLNA